MIKTTLFLLVLVIIIALIWGKPTLTTLWRRWLKARPFPLRWITILNQTTPLYKRLPESLRKRLHGHINVFLTEKKFKGCGSLQLSDEIKLTIAAQACLLLLNERGKYYPKLFSILVYPNAFIASKTKTFGDYYLEDKQVKIGESWHIGIVVLSWESIRHNAMQWQDGHNVVLHEFAHQLDQEDGTADGVPILGKKSDYLTWANVFRTEYEKLRSEVEQGFETVIDEYGTTDPAEFFAVATETFFEKSKQMKRKHPELYSQLKRYYRLDPAEW